ncbi:hypothetical protein SAMD00019534_002390 [Acytostelium subglobosum LB1]|uniref:hypothetical protein n=1 Tax=Acytostelium subglobosum LB1 TaxID=1410327 RepID=UPI000644B478|nr:hypothetical protein SAMD00019534_002390 [Acytostelium subglobosum LB1]GAM17064.1 hypothetical protein SAMD00019534_002390 [Acytostelium subglobosum LB1]|eukprot:XP_012759126.1 hypothetical protein SAMD00019534_002390 [Acytostelium subglobosum LB1]
MLSKIGTFLRKLIQDQHVDKDLNSEFKKSLDTLNDDMSDEVQLDKVYTRDYLLSLVSQVLGMRQQIDPEIIASLEVLVNNLTWYQGGTTHRKLTKLVKFGIICPEPNLMKDACYCLSLAVTESHWSYFVLINQTFLKTLLESVQTQQDEIDHLFTLYIFLMESYHDCPNCYENISLAFGPDRVRQVSPPIREWLKDATMVSENKQQVFDYIIMEGYWTTMLNDLPTLFTIIFEDEMILKDSANQRELVKMIMSSGAKADEVFTLVKPYLLPFELEYVDCLLLLKNIHNISSLIGLIGESFSKVYLEVESKIINIWKSTTWSSNYTPLILLDDVVQAFRNVENASQVLRPLVWCLDSLHLLKHIAKARPSNHTPKAIRGLIGLMETCLETSSSNNLYYAAMLCLVDLHEDEHRTLVEDLVHRYQDKTQLFVDIHYHRCIDKLPTVNVNFLIACHNHSLLSGIKHERLLFKVLKHCPRVFKVQQFISRCAFSTSIWTQYMDSLFARLHRYDHLYTPISYAEEYNLVHVVLEPPIKVVMVHIEGGGRIHPVPAFQLLKHLYNFRVYPFVDRKRLFSSTDIGDINLIKQHILDNIDVDHADYVQQQQLYTQFKQQSLAKRQTHQVDPTVWHKLHPLTVQHIIYLLVMDDLRAPIIHSRWVVSLATVSKQFHKAVMTSVSKNPVPSLYICSTLKHIGSTYCLFQSTPLHLEVRQLEHIPTDLLQECIDRLQSFVFQMEDGLLQAYAHTLTPRYVAIDAPNLRHIRFDLQRLKSNNEYPLEWEKHLTPLLKHLPVNPSPITITQHKHLSTNLYEHYIKDKTSLQSITFLTDTLANPLPDGAVAKSTVNVSFQLWMDSTKQPSNHSGSHITTLNLTLEKDLGTLPHLPHLNKLILEGHSKKLTRSYCQQLQPLYDRLTTLVVTASFLPDTMLMLPLQTNTIQSLHLVFTNVDLVARSELNQTLKTHVNTLMELLKKPMYSRLSLLTMRLDHQYKGVQPLNQQTMAALLYPYFKPDVSDLYSYYRIPFL